MTKRNKALFGCCQNVKLQFLSLRITVDTLKAKRLKVMVWVGRGVARGIENQTKVAARLSTVGRVWLTLEEGGDCGRPFRCIADGSGECDRLFHNLQKRLD